MYLTEERVTLTKLELEIIISSDERDEIKMILGICGSDINYAELMNQMFNLDLQGVSWLNYEKVCKLPSFNAFCINRKLCEVKVMCFM